MARMPQRLSRPS